MINNMQMKKNSVSESFPFVFGIEELHAKVVESFPYPILIYDINGTAVLVNQAMLREFHISSPNEVVGKFNILKEPFIIKAGIINSVTRAFQGEEIFLTDIKAPLEDISNLHHLAYDFDIEALYQDITFFPMRDHDMKLLFIVVFLMNRRIYRGKDEISRAKKYIENHWLDPFDLNGTAKAAGLSKTHFTRQFKKHTGMTPHDYYITYKVNKLKDQLMDFNLSISQAFASCGIDYNGHFARVFKEKTGISPSQYRNTVHQGR